jgi:hypothetical protein
MLIEMTKGCVSAIFLHDFNNRISLSFSFLHNEFYLKNVT